MVVHIPEVIPISDISSLRRIGRVSVVSSVNTGSQLIGWTKRPRGVLRAPHPETLDPVELRLFLPLQKLATTAEQ